MANEISHPRELAALVVRRVGVVSVIVPAEPAKQEERKEGRKERVVPFRASSRWKGSGCKTRKQDGDRTLALSLPASLRVFSGETGAMGATSCSGWINEKRGRDRFTAVKRDSGLIKIPSCS